MSDPVFTDHFNRRDLLLGVGMLGVLGLSDAHAGGHSGPRVLLSPEEQKELEAANEDLVNRFMRDYSTRDVDVLAQYLADDIVYQVSEGQKEVLGLAAYRKRTANTMAGLEKVDWQVLRSFAIGQIVINERIDEFYPPPGSRIPRMRFHVAGYFLVKDNKIQVWRDFGYPGAKQLVEPAPKA
ncbi:MAG: limonene-1,2-epoxide hydrolase family protein [Gammaproteobacteria bacterium]